MIRSLTVLFLTMWFSIPADAANLKKFDWRAGEGSVTFQIELDAACAPRMTNQALKNKYFFVDYYGLDGPAENAQWDIKAPGVFHVKRVYYPSQRVLRLVFYTKGDVHVAMGGDQRRQQLQVTPVNYGKIGDKRSGTARKRIVIDPGHGGRPGDAEWHMGAESSSPIGGRTIYEKDVTLAIAERLAALISRASNMEAVLTRRDDVYVSLPRRVEIAEQAQGDLFVSIHLNATDTRRKTARGFEIYYLSDGSKVVNRHLLALENEWPVDMDDKTSSREDIREILRSLAGDKLAERQAQSSRLAELIGDEFRQYGISRDEYRGVKSMPFRVLVQYTMPAVLAECYFLDNNTEAAQLVRPDVQDQIAALLFNGINRYVALSDPRFVPQLADRNPAIAARKDAASGGRP